MNIQPLLDEVEAIKRDNVKFENGNKAAGTRIRRNLLNLKKMTIDMRIDAQNIIGNTVGTNNQ
jgi:long-subunit fatty acid transport protein